MPNCSGAPREYSETTLSLRRVAKQCRFLPRFAEIPASLRSGPAGYVALGPILRGRGSPHP